LPFLAIVHLQALQCRECGAPLAQPGARSFIVDSEGSPRFFDPADPPAEMTVEMTCPNGHALELFVPNEISAEETLMTPENAPLAGDAALLSGTAESGAAL
jgi:hypothetical protein